MKKAVETPCTCPNCKKETLSFVDGNGRRYSYRTLLNLGTVDKIHSELNRLRLLTHIECTNCREEYPIDWSFIIPRALDEYPENISFYTPDNF